MADPIDVQTHPWYNREHHAEDGGFRNVWPPYGHASVAKGTLWFLRTLFRRKDNRLPKVRAVDGKELRTAPSAVELTWIGHSTVLVRTPYTTLLLDPNFGRRASPISFAGPKREPALPLQLGDLPPVQVVVLSHDHYDHLDRGTAEALVRQNDPLFLVPIGVAGHLKSWGISRVAELDWWQFADACGIQFHCVPAKHFSGRSHLDRDETLWAGWYVEMDDGGTRLFYAGDTGYASHFTQIRERLGAPQIAVLPIGAYLPPWLMQPVHVNPQEALQAFADLGSAAMIPVHWGTFDLAEEPLHEPADVLRRLITERSLTDRVHLLDIGQMWRLEADTSGAR